MLLCFIILIAVGAILVWHFLPANNKALVKQGVSNSPVTIPTGGGSGGGSSSSSSSSTSTQSSPLPNYTFNQCSSNNINNCCNGVDTICDLKVNEILIASVHNGQSSVDEGFYLVANQQYKFEIALEAGFRGMKVELGMCNGQILMIHGVCSLGSRDPLQAFQDLASFFAKNPREVFVLQLEFQVIDNVAVNINDVYALMKQANLTQYIYVKPDPAAYWPTMRELINNNTRLLTFTYGGPSCMSSDPCPTGIYNWFYYGMETQYTFTDVAALENISYACNITRGQGGYGDFFAVNNFITDILPSKTDAQIVNQKPFVVAHMDACAKYNNHSVNIIFVDFWNYGNLVQVQQKYNMALGNGTAHQRRLLRQRLTQALAATAAASPAQVQTRPWSPSEETGFST